MSYFQFACIPVEVFGDRRLGLNDLKVLGMLFGYTNPREPERICWPKKSSIAEWTGISINKISQITARLVNFGWIEKTGDGGRHRPATYTINQPSNSLPFRSETSTHSVLDSLLPSAETSTHSVLPPVGNQYPFGTGHVINHINKNKPAYNTLAPSEPQAPPNETTSTSQPSAKRAPARSVFLDSFDKFWNAYPRKTAKGRAEKEWLKLRPDEQLVELILTAVEAKKSSGQWQESGGRFIPYPAKFIADQRWEDAPESETSHRAPSRPRYETSYQRSQRKAREYLDKLHGKSTPSNMGGRVFEGDFIHEHV